MPLDLPRWTRLTARMYTPPRQCSHPAHATGEASTNARTITRVNRGVLLLHLLHTCEPGLSNENGDGVKITSLGFVLERNQNN